MGKERKRTRIPHKKRRGVRFSNDQIETRLPIISVPVSFDENSDNPLEAIVVRKSKIKVKHPNSEEVDVFNFTSNLYSQISSAEGLMRFGFTPSLMDSPNQTWPMHYEYLDRSLKRKLNELGLEITSRKNLMTSALNVSSFGKHLYHVANAESFFDGWIEVFWQDYVLEHELRRYRQIGAIEFSGEEAESIPFGELNLSNAEAWFPLENCSIRIRSMWETLLKQMIPIYFSGEFAPDRPNKKFWQQFNNKIRELITPEQIVFYELLIKSIRDFESSPLKNFRDLLIHQTSIRPFDVLRSSHTEESELPKTVKELFNLVKKERERIREALIIFTGVILLKEPKNEEV